MFETEAEEYAKQNNPAEYGVRATHFTVLNSFKDGAEFGYNKANEWHYMRKNPNDLPKECKGKLYLVNIYSDSQLKFEYAEYTPTVCLWNSEWERFEILELTVGSRIVNTRNVIAWKEIVLPELPKESE
jgi:hypothetical protein